MKVVIFGANGKVGKLLVREALVRDHEVTAVVRNEIENQFPSSVRVIEADIHDASSVEGAVKGSGAVVSALGSWGTSTQDILVAGMNNIIPAMEKHRIRRIISLTGADARFKGDRISISSRVLQFILQRVAPKVYKDGQNHITLLASSGLDWTVIRSPKMKNGDPAHYELGTLSTQAWHTVSRATIASAMLDQLDSNDFLHKAPIIKQV